jgi:hypothetical protein
VARRRLAQAEIDAELMATLMDNWNTALEKARARL